MEALPWMRLPTEETPLSELAPSLMLAAAVVVAVLAAAVTMVVVVEEGERALPAAFVTWEGSAERKKMKIVTSTGRSVVINS